MEDCRECDIELSGSIKCGEIFNSPEPVSLSRMTLTNSVALVRERTIPTERPPPVGEVSANFCG